MKVSKLIKRLSLCDPDAEVYIETHQCIEGTKEEVVRVRKLNDSELDEENIESGVVIE